MVANNIVSMSLIQSMNIDIARHLECHIQLPQHDLLQLRIKCKKTRKHQCIATCFQKMSTVSVFNNFNLTYIKVNQGFAKPRANHKVKVEKNKKEQK